MLKKLYLILSCLFVAHLSFAQYGDCSSAKDICKKTPLHFTPRGEGSDTHEADFMHCFMNGDNFGQAEENSTWIKFEIMESGTFAFVITPDYAGDDIDFVVFRLPADGDCTRKEVVRCMAAGAQSDQLNSPCLGATGLRSGELDSSEDAGCADLNDNTWLAPLKTVKGEKYVLLVSNVTAPRGFNISFSGNAKLPCEKKTKPIAEKETVKPEPVKPADPPKPKDPPPPPPKVTEVPAEIGGRKVEVGETVKVKTHKIKVKIWDSQIADGDVVSIFIGDKKVLDHYLLTTEPKEFIFDLPDNEKEHYLTVFADDFGKSEPNTAAVIINDGVNEQRIDLTAGRKKQQSVKIITE